MSKICIAIDAMGGDHGPSVTVPSALKVLRQHPNLHLILVGNEEKLLQTINTIEKDWDRQRLQIHNATQVVQMDELPSSALRTKKDSSMRVALNLVQSNHAQACVSAGNTGALMATARFVLKMLPGIDRPAILFPIPSQKGVVQVLDLGANVECEAEHLFQFAVMGSILVTATNDNPSPKVGLLNIGAEEIKGTDAVKNAAILCQNAKSLNYVGFVEGDDIYKGEIDVVVCDGFVGNVALKASEGVAKMMLSFTKLEFEKNIFTKAMALCCRSILKKIFLRFDPNKYNGGSLLGLQGVVLKSHGNANIEAFSMAIEKAIKEIEFNVPDKIRNAVDLMLKDAKTS